jgi:hypothetical protein
MSEPAPAESPSPPSIIIRIIADHTRAIKALTATSANSLDYAILLSSYENMISLTHMLYCSENLTDQFATLATKNEDLMLEQDTTIADHNTLTAQVTQLKAQLAQTLALANIATSSSPASYKGQTDPEKFTREDHGKLRSFVALLHLRLIDCPREFLNDQLKLWYAFSRLEGAMLEQLIHLMKDDRMNLGNLKAFVTLLEEAYGDPNCMNTAEWALAKLCQGNRDLVMYYAEF